VRNWFDPSAPAVDSGAVLPGAIAFYVAKTENNKRGKFRLCSRGGALRIPALASAGEVFHRKIKKLKFFYCNV
jgi:hypothetical protein